MKLTKVLNIAAVLSLGAAGSAYAAASSAQTFTDAGTMTVGAPTVIIKPSKNVKVVYKASSDVAGNGAAMYSISSFHSSGTKLYASSSGDTKIFMKDATVIADPPTAPAVGASMSDTGYTAL